MAKLRVFVSSTYYDLKHLRANLEAFIKSMGYEPVLFESGDIGFLPDKPLDDSCYKEIHNAHMQVLIIGGNYGSPATADHIKPEEKENHYKKFNSITKTEFLTALELKLPIYFFVENGVLAEYDTFKKNRNNDTIQYAHVSSVNVFYLLDEIYSLKEGNFVQGFSKFEDISSWLKLQWAHLFADFIVNNKQQLELSTLNNSLEQLNSVTESLKIYSEAILKNQNPDEFQKVKGEVDDTIKNHKLANIASDTWVKQSSKLLHLTPLEFASIFLSTKDYNEFSRTINALAHKNGSGSKLIEQGSVMYNKLKSYL
ncbi:DUF4062 domain-containing protein [Pedobacter cryotolerans]|uniref:DUF4062 domain-containing protein n=1 Tax=Pedobacter cryotolerans TaxID=2571270 RepID=UPI00145D31BB|nr:DUF4062 domain-containing protein [Pedobacter cryotolerans]